MTARQSQDRVHVVGGGIVGVACSHYLAHAGHAVTVIDRSTVGSGCSHANLGFICPSHVLPLNEPRAIREAIASVFDRTAPFRVKPQFRLSLYRWLAQFARRCTHDKMIDAGRRLQPLLDSSMAEYRQLFATLPSAGQWKENGLLYAFRTDAAMEAFAQTDELLSETYGISATRIEGTDLPGFDHALRADLAGAFFYDHDGSVRPDTLLRDWRRHLADVGVEFVEDCRVVGVKTAGSRIVALETSRGEMEAEQYVFATGAWSSEFSTQLGIRIPIEPGKGYSITMSPPSFCPTHPMLFPEHRIGIAPFDEGYRIGSMMEFVGYDSSIPERRITQLTDSAAPYLQTPVGDEIVETWYGWRPMTWDSLPIVGRIPGLENGLLATGHNMLGMTLAAGTGRLIGELVDGQTPHIDIDAFSASRFQ